MGLATGFRDRNKLYASKLTYKEYRYKQLEKDIMASQQKRKRKTMSNILPTKSKFSVRKAAHSSPGLSAVIHGHLNDRDNTSVMPPSQILNETKSRGQLRHKSERIANNTQTTTGNYSNGAVNTLGDTFCINNSDKNVRVFYEWTVMLNNQYQLVIKGVLECGTPARSKPVHKRLSAFSVMSIFQHTYVLKENLVDEGNELPDYVKSKFYNGFPDDWENVYHLWKNFIMEGCRESFCWPSLSENSDDDLGSEITDVTIIDAYPRRSKRKALSPVEIDDASNTDDTADSLLCSPLKICKITDSSTQTPNLWQKSSNNINKRHYVKVLTQTQIMEKFNIQKEKLVCTLNNLAEVHWPQECLLKMIEMIECFNFVISYKLSEEDKSKQLQAGVYAVNSIVEPQNFNEATSEMKSLHATNNTTCDKRDLEHSLCNRSPQKKYSQQSGKGTNTHNTPDSDKNSYYAEEENINFKGFKQNRAAHNFRSNDISSPRTVTAKPYRQKGNMNSITNDINYSPLNKDDTNHVQLKEHVHANTDANCHDYTDTRTKAVSAEVDNISSEDSDQGDTIAINNNANTNLTFESHSKSPQKKRVKPSIHSSEKININMKILPRRGSIFMQDDSDSSFSDNDKESVHTKTLQTHKAVVQPHPQNIDFNDVNISNSEKLDYKKNSSPDSFVEQTELSCVPGTSKQHAFGSEANPKIITSWFPNVLPRQNDESRFGLVFEGNLLNKTGHVVKEKFITGFVLRRMSVKLFESIDGEYYQLIGPLLDSSVVPKHMQKQCRKGCPADIDKFCKMWKLEKTGSPDRVHSASVSDLNVQVSSRGRKVLPPLRYWSGERAVMKDDNLAYDSGNFDISIITTVEQTPTKASDVRNQENRNANSRTFVNQPKSRSKSTDKLNRSKRNKSLIKSNQAANKSMRKNESNDPKTTQVADAAEKEKMLRKRIAQQLQFRSSGSDTDEMTENVPQVIVQESRSEYVSKLRKRKKMDDSISNQLPRMSTTHIPSRGKSGNRERNSNVSCTYILKSTPSPETLSEDEMSIVN